MLELEDGKGCLKTDVFIGLAIPFGPLILRALAFGALRTVWVVLFDESAATGSVRSTGFAFVTAGSTLSFDTLLRVSR